MKKLLLLCLATLMLMSGCSSNTTEPEATATPEATEEANTEAATEMTGTITVYTRDASSGTREAFEGAIDLEELTATAVETTGNGDMATKVGAEESAIGYVSLSTDFEANNIVPLQFEGVSPTIDTVLDGSYAMQRPFSYTSRTSGEYTSDEVEQLVLAFLDFLNNSVEGKQAVESAGGIVDYTNATPWAELSANHPIVSQDNSAFTIRTGGSTSVEKSIAAALESFQPLAGNVQFTMNHTGSSDGHKRTLGSEKDSANAIDIGFASREFKAEEDNTNALESGVYCIDAVVAVVNAANTSVTNLSQADINGIYSGTVSTWDSIGQ